MELFDWLLSKKEKYNINGRKVVIVIKSKGVDIRILKEEILDVMKTYNFPEDFPNITFLIETFKQNNRAPASAFVDPDKLKRKKAFIHINTEILTSFKDMNLTKLKELISDTLKHEITHIWHDYKSGAIQRQAKVGDRMYKNVYRTLYKEDSIEELYNTIRFGLAEFINKLYTEGLAEYKTLYTSSNSNYEFQNNYRKAKSRAEYTIKELNNIITLITPKNVSKIIEDVDYITSNGDLYTIGLHMTYVILYIDNETNLNQVANLTAFKFIKKYESCMKKVNLKPVVSLTSGEGIIDYKRLVNQIWIKSQKT